MAPISQPWAYNMNYERVGWFNPVADNKTNFETMKSNKIQLARIWLSQWSIFGSFNEPWKWVGDNPDYINTNSAYAYGDHGFSMILDNGYNPCLSTGHWHSAPIAVKSSTTYRVRVRARTLGVTTPVNASYPYGLVAKVTTSGSPWLWDSTSNNCNQSGVGTTVTSYLTGNSGWTEISGNFTTDSSTNFLGSFYLTLTNVSGSAFARIDHVWMEEVKGAGVYGPNILPKAGVSILLITSMQRTSAAFDKVLELAHTNDVYLRPVVIDLNDEVLASIGNDGNPTTRSVANIYGSSPKVRWLLQAYWRYLQARWGYSTNIQSWELLNEGNPGDAAHSDLANEFGKYMHCSVFGNPVTGSTCSTYENSTTRQPNSHLVSTSNWTEYTPTFWNACPNCDFTDLHRYIPQNDVDSWEDPNFYDSAKSTYDNKYGVWIKNI